MPAGECRELRPFPRRVDGIIAHHGLVRGAATALRRSFWVAEPPASAVAAFAGLGRPADFLEGLDRRVARFWALSDHQPVDEVLARRLVAWADGHPLVTTAKDAVRLPSWLRDAVFVRDLVVEVPDADPLWFPEAP